MTASTPTHEDLLDACIKLVPRLGTRNFELRYSEPELDKTTAALAGDGTPAHESPTVWIAIAIFPGAPPQVGAALTPAGAAYRLLEQLIDGGQCTHCKRPTGITDDFAAAMPAAGQVCWYRYDPELKVFRRSCEGRRP
jgi:hypothetical protein